MSAEDRARIGARLRTERKGRGWDKAEMARRLAKAAGDARSSFPHHDTLVDYVKRWERGGAGVSERYRMLYAAALGMAEADLFADRTPLGRPHPAGDVLNGEFTPDDEERLIRSAAVSGRRVRRVDTGLVNRLRRRTARLRRLDDVLGGADTYRLYAAELAATTALIDEASYTDATGRALLAVVAEQAQQAGWAAFDAGWHTPARRLFKDSLIAASDSGDTSLIANSLAFLAYQKVSTGQHGVSEADASCRVADSGDTPAAVQALLLERAAWAHAVAGHAREADEALNLASEALHREHGLPDPDWALWVDETELQIMTGRCWSILKKPSRAIPALDQALNRYDDTHARDKALYLTWLADAHIDGGNIDQAAVVAGRALELSTDVASVRPRQRIDEVIQRLESYRGLPKVAELFDQAKEAERLRQLPDSPTPGTPPILPEQ